MHTAERFARSIKDECLNRMIFVGEASLRRAVMSSWRITMPRGIIKAWVIDLSAPNGPQCQRIVWQTGVSGSVGCSVFISTRLRKSAYPGHRGEAMRLRGG